MRLLESNYLDCLVLDMRLLESNYLDCLVLDMRLLESNYLDCLVLDIRLLESNYLDCLVLLLEGPAEDEGKHNPRQLKEPHADADSADDADVVRHVRRERREASTGVDLHRSVVVVLGENATSTSSDI